MSINKQLQKDMKALMEMKSERVDQAMQKNPWKDLIEFECGAGGIPFNEDSPDDTLASLFHYYQKLGREPTDEGAMIIQENSELKQKLNSYVDTGCRIAAGKERLKKENGELKAEVDRLKEIERRYRWIEEHLDNFDQLNIPQE